MVDLARIGELRAMVGQVAGTRSTIQGFGDPSRLAGDPGALRALAGSHRDAASGLLSAADQGRTQVGTLVGGPWQGPASDAFSGFWSGVDGQVQDLAGRHARMATALDEIAGMAGTLNGQVADVLGRIESWLGAAAAAIGTVDVGAVPGLVGAASTILATWRTLRPELEAFAGSLAPRMEIDLGISLPAPWPSPVDGAPPPGIRLPGILITTPAPRLPSILITTPAPRPPNILINVPGPQGPGILITTPAPRLPNILINVPGPGGPSIVTAKPADPGKGGPPQGERVPPPRDLPAFPDAKRVKPRTPVQGGGGLRARWKGEDGRIYEWDSQHGAVEVYDRRGRSLGEYDPNTGQQTKPPDPTRRVEP